MVQPKQIEPVEDVLESAFCAMAATRKEVIESLSPVFQLLHLPFHDLPQPASAYVDVMPEIR